MMTTTKLNLWNRKMTAEPVYKTWISFEDVEGGGFRGKTMGVVLCRRFDGDRVTDSRMNCVDGIWIRSCT